MKNFKLYGYTNGNKVLITDSLNLSSAATFEENFSIQEHMKASLSFKISDILDDGTANPFVMFVYPKAKIRLEYTENTTTKVIDFLIIDISSEFYQNAIIYSVNAEDYASQTYAKQGLGLSLGENGKTGNIEEIAKEIVAISRKNLDYVNFSTNYIDLYNYKSLVNGTLKDGSMRVVTAATKMAVTLLRNKNISSTIPYFMEFDLRAGSFTSATVVEKGAQGSIIATHTFSLSTGTIYKTASFTPLTTMSYLEIGFNGPSATLSVFGLKLRKYKVILTPNAPKFTVSDCNSKYVNPIGSLTYYKTATLLLDNSNLYNALIELANLFDSIIEFDYDLNTVSFTPRNSGAFKGYPLSPTFNMRSLARDESASESITALRVIGSEDVYSIFPDVPTEFRTFFNEQIDATPSKFPDFNDYATTTYTDVADSIIAASPTMTQDRKDLILEFAAACDAVPNYENVIYDLRYFYNTGKITLATYNAFNAIIRNNLRKINIEISTRSMTYNEYYSQLSNKEININDVTAPALNSEQILLKEEIDGTQSEYLYTDIDSNLVGQNLLPNTNFGSSDDATLVPSDYKILGVNGGTGISYPIVSPIYFAVNKTELFEKENSLKFTYAAPVNPSTAWSMVLLTLKEDSLIEVVDNALVGKTMRFSTYVYKPTTGGIANIVPKFCLTTYNADKTVHVINDLESAAIVPTATWTRVSWTVVIPADVKYIAPSIEMNFNASPSGVMYFAKPQFEIEVVGKSPLPWTNEDYVDISRAGFNLLKNSNFLDLTSYTALGRFTYAGGWQLYNTGAYTIDTTVKNEGNNSLKFNWSSNLSAYSYIASDFIDVARYGLAKKTVTFSAYIYIPTGATMINNPYLSIGTYINANSTQGAGGTEANEENNENYQILLKNIPERDKWVRVSFTKTLPATNKNAYGTIRYIRAMIRYNKYSTATPGLSTDLFYISMPQLEIGSKATNWSAYYNIDGDRKTTYKFYKPYHKLSTGDEVELSFYNNDIYATNMASYPADRGTYYVVDADGDYFKLSKVKDGTPIVYNLNYLNTHANSLKWKLTSFIMQRNTDEWIDYKNRVANIEDKIYQYQRDLMIDYGLLFDISNTPIGLKLTNSNTLYSNSYLFYLFSLYGYTNPYINGLEQRIFSTQELVNKIYNSRTQKTARIVEIETETAAKIPGITNINLALLDGEKAGLESEMEAMKHTIGVFTEKIEQDVTDMTFSTMTKTSLDQEYVTQVPFTKIGTPKSYVGYFLKIVSADGLVVEYRRILAQNNTTQLFTVAYWIADRDVIYSFAIVKEVEDFTNREIMGKYGIELYYLKQLKTYLDSSRFAPTLMDYSEWLLGTNGVDRTPKVGDWNYTGTAAVTKSDYEEIMDIMVKMTSTGTGNPATLTCAVVTPTTGLYRLSYLSRLDVWNGSSWENGDWGVTVVDDTVNRTAGSYTITITHPGYVIGTTRLFVYRPRFELISVYTYTDPERLSLYDNPIMLNYIATRKTVVDVSAGLDNILYNKDYSGNIINMKDQIIYELYRDYGDYLFEGYYENSDEVSSLGLLAQALAAMETYKYPKINFNTSIIDMSAIEDFQFLTIKVGDKVLISEPTDRMYKSYELSPTNKYLDISSISYDLRQPDSGSLTVSRYDQTKILVEKLLASLTK